MAKKCLKIPLLRGLAIPRQAKSNKTLWQFFKDNKGQPTLGS